MNNIFTYIKNNKKQVAIGLSSALLLFLLIILALRGCSDGKSVSNGDNATGTSGASEASDGNTSESADPDELMAAGIDDVLSPTEEETKLSEYLEAVSLSLEDQSDEENADSEDDDTDEYSNLAIATVDNYVNVRTEPNTSSEIVGKMYDEAVAEILEETEGEDGLWYKVVSGDVEGYIKAEYFVRGDEVASHIDDYIIKYAVVKCDRLNIRKEPSTDSERIGYALYGEALQYLEDDGEWVKIWYTSDKEGYVSKEYVNIEESFIYAKTVEQEEEATVEEEEREERQEVTEETAPEVTETTVVEEVTSVSYSTNSELRSAIVNYALNYVGNRYVHGGQSLETGTDCSGFTCLILKQFGYSVARTPQGQYTGAGRAVTYDELQPGDIVCYSSNGSTCTHVAFYIGNGQIVHAANSRKGVIVSDINYMKSIIGYRNVLD